MYTPLLLPGLAVVSLLMLVIVALAIVVALVEMASEIDKVSAYQMT